MENEYTVDCPELEEINNLAQHASSMSYEAFSEIKSATECVETISDTLETQRLVENILKTETDIPPPLETSYKQQSDLISTTIETDSQCSIALADKKWSQKSESDELKRPTQFTPNTMERKLPSKIENAVPLKWESPLTQALRTTEPDPDTFAAIPSKQSHSALASALAIAPSQPFTPPSSHITFVSLPEETIPYLPPERPVISDDELIRKTKSKSQLVKALEIVPEPRCATPVRGVPPPVKNKPKDPMEKYFEELPKPQQKLSLLAALTTAPERSYSPLITENMSDDKLQHEKLDKGRSKEIDNSLLTSKNPDVLPESFSMHKKDPKPPGYYPPQMIYQKTEQSKSEEHTEESNTSTKTTIEKHTIQNPQKTQIIVTEDQPNVQQNYAPLFQGFSCSFQNKTDHSKFSVEINTTPPVLSPPPKAVTPVLKTVETSGFVQKETVTEEKHERLQTSKKLKTSSEQFKQAEEIVLKKTNHPVALHKPESLPQYQVQLEQEAEADLILLERKQKAQQRLEELKMRQQHTSINQQTSACDQNVKTVDAHLTKQVQQNRVETSKKPIIKIESEYEEILQKQNRFRPIVDERPPSRTFSPRPGTVTPSMINKPPAILPYYQTNLVPQKMSALEASIFDPKSPAISRSPSPCRGMKKEHSPSPFRSETPVRGLSPAPGPPANPLTSPQPLPSPNDSKIEKARENLTTFIPEYKSKRDLLESTQNIETYKRAEEVEQAVQNKQCIQPQQKSVQSDPSIRNSSQMYSSTVQTRSYPLQQQILGTQKQSFEKKQFEVLETDSAKRFSSQTAAGTVSTAIDEQTKQAHMEQLKQSQSQSIQRSADGLTQVQRKQVVTEEYERTQKETNIQIQKNITNLKKHPFKEVNTSGTEALGVVGMHVTNPQPISSPFLKPSGHVAEKQVQSDKQHNTHDQILHKQNNEYQMNSSVQQAEKLLLLSTNKTGPALSTNDKFKPASCPTKHVFAPTSIAPVKHVDPPGSSKKSSQSVIKPNVSQPNTGVGGGRQAGGISVAPRRGRGVLNAAAIGGARIPLCGSCNMQIRYTIDRVNLFLVFVIACYVPFSFIF